MIYRKKPYFLSFTFLKFIKIVLYNCFFNKRVNHGGLSNVSCPGKRWNYLSDLRNYDKLRYMQENDYFAMT